MKHLAGANWCQSRWAMELTEDKERPDADQARKVNHNHREKLNSIWFSS